MRMRKKKHGEERRAVLQDIFLDPATLTPASLAESFGNGNRCELEIGCGKGSFIVQLAKRHPDINFVAMERVSDVILLAAERCAAEAVPNVRFLCGNAALLSSYFAPGEISKIYLNFSDPWPKKGYAKRRLTHPGFLDTYRSLLPPGGEIALKTDNAALFDFSLESFAACGFTVSEVTRDLHHSAWNADNIETEYEARFAACGMPIHRAVARKTL